MTVTSEPAAVVYKPSSVSLQNARSIQHQLQSNHTLIPSPELQHQIHLATMKLTSILTTILTFLTSIVLADFSIYAAGIGGNGISGNADGWQVYPVTSGVIKCDQALEWIWRSSKDASGDKYGVRCDGEDSACVRGGPGKGIKELEFNTRQSGKDSGRSHFSKFFTTGVENLDGFCGLVVLMKCSAAFYKNRGLAIVNLNGKKIGTCKPAPEQDFYCGITAGRAEGTRKLDCTCSLTAKDFKQPV